MSYQHGHSGVKLETEPDTLSLTFQKHVLHGIRQTSKKPDIVAFLPHELSSTVLIYMHRSFMARALKENPDDPLRSPFGASVLEAFECSRLFMASVNTLYTLFPATLKKVWFIWSHV